MSVSQINNHRIAKNTIYLYVRTLVVMLISLYTSRVILNVLGVEDYGVYQVIGGLVAMFSIISSSLSSAISRYITFEIGSENNDRLNRIFATSKLIQLLITIIVLIATEIIGLWFLKNHMQIPDGRMNAAVWVLQFSLFTFCINLLSVPYNACIIAYEHMKTFAYVSLIETILRLLICYLIILSPIDKLITYAFLLSLVAISIRVIYICYCHKHFIASRTKLHLDKEIFKNMFGFAGWSFLTHSASVFNNQGVNMLINVFFGVTVNAARGIAIQVENAVMQFVTNFTTAVNPQITKSYAAGDLEGMHRLVCRGSKFSFFAMFIMALPLIMEIRQILSIWLIEIPDNTAIFVQLSLVLGMCDSIGQAGYTACMATGNLRKYAIVITSIGFLEFPLTWIFFILGAPVVSTYYLFIIVKIAVLIARMFLLQSMIGLRINVFISEVFTPIIKTIILAPLPLIIISHIMEPSMFRLIITVLIGILSVASTVYWVGINNIERRIITSKIISKINSFKLS